MEHHFNVQIAEQYGIEEAILIHHFYYWISKNAANETNFHDGLYWTYNSKRAYACLFTYMNETKIFRVIKHLEECGLIVKGNYNEDKWDRTNWYAISIEGIYYLQSVGYDCRLLQNGAMHCIKMNDGECQSEQSILINNTDNKDINSKQEKEDTIISSKKKAKKSDEPIVIAPEMQEIVDTWMQYKKEKGQSYKPTGFKTFYKNLCELSGNNPQVAMAIIEQSMRNNYAGIFPLKNNNNINGYGRETITDKIRRTVEEANKFSEQLRSRIGEQADVCNGDNDEVW